eukprot:scaffold639_cov304-Pinguiococcus_pyrenoidosus.AAC.11
MDSKDAIRLLGGRIEVRAYRGKRHHGILVRELRQVVGVYVDLCRRCPAIAGRCLRHSVEFLRGEGLPTKDDALEDITVTVLRDLHDCHHPLENALDLLRLLLVRAVSREQRSGSRRDGHGVLRRQCPAAHEARAQRIRHILGVVAHRAAVQQPDGLHAKPPRIRVRAAQPIEASQRAGPEDLLVGWSHELLKEEGHVEIVGNAPLHELIQRLRERC